MLHDYLILLRTISTSPRTNEWKIRILSRNLATLEAMSRAETACGGVI